jgi:hypothetical protein
MLDSDESAGRLKTYVVFRRRGWPSAAAALGAVGRSAGVAAAMEEDVHWLSSYVLSESDRSLGTVCLFEATDPEAIRAHADAADLPVDEIVTVADTHLGSDPVPTLTKEVAP